MTYDLSAPSDQLFVNRQVKDIGTILATLGSLNSSGSYRIAEGGKISTDVHSNDHDLTHNFELETIGFVDQGPAKIDV